MSPMEQLQRENREQRMALDIQCAKCEAVGKLLEKLEAVVTKAGGHMGARDQATLREVRAALVELGIRKSNAPPLWVDHK